jgi:hypothetical protein
MGIDRHSAQRMLDIVREVCASAAVADSEHAALPQMQPRPDLNFLEDISGNDFDVSAVLERFISDAHRD